MSISSITNGPPCSTCMAALLFMTVSFDRSSPCPYLSQHLPQQTRHVRQYGEPEGFGRVAAICSPRCLLHHERDDPGGRQRDPRDLNVRPRYLVSGGTPPKAALTMAWRT